MFSNNPIFIGCLSKSGASLLRSLVGNHPSIYGGDGFETNWFGDDINKQWQNQNTKRQKWLMEWHRIDEDKFKAIKEHSFSGFDYFNNVMNYCTERDNKTRWLEKSPHNIYHYDLIMEIWPNAKFILAVRDLRDIFASWKVNSGSTLKKYDVWEFIDLASTALQRYEQLIGKETPNYIDVKYEETVFQTQETLRRVYEYLGEPWIDGLEIYTPSGELEKVKKIIGKGSTTSESLEKPIFSSSIGQWEHKISSKEATAIENELGHFLKLLGYMK